MDIWDVHASNDGHGQSYSPVCKQLRNGRRLLRQDLWLVQLNEGAAVSVSAGYAGDSAARRGKRARKPARRERSRRDWPQCQSHEGQCTQYGAGTGFNARAAHAGVDGGLPY